MSASNSEDATTLIRRSLERELGLLEMKKRLTQEQIKEFERQYGMDSTEFIKRFEAGKLGDSQDCFEWWGLLRGLGAIEKEIKKARAVLFS
ncbi:Uncharacterised protein [uncultured archaeon]|nr:Uncharacterised protein [uncultured archaeon]